MNTWEVARTGDSDRLQELLAAGWEPFAVVLTNVGYLYFLKRAVTNSQPEEPTIRHETCWRAPNAHPPHPWHDDNNQPMWCPGVKGTTMY